MDAPVATSRRTSSSRLLMMGRDPDGCLAIWAAWSLSEVTGAADGEITSFPGRPP